MSTFDGSARGEPRLSSRSARSDKGLSRWVDALVITLSIEVEVVHVVVWELVSDDALGHLHGVAVHDGGPAHDIDVSHVVLGALVHNGVVGVVSADDAVVDLIEWSGSVEADMAKAITSSGGWALSLTSDGLSWGADGSLEGVLHDESLGVIVELGVLGDGADPSVWLVWLVLGVGVGVPGSHVGNWVEALEWLDDVASDFVGLEEETHCVRGSAGKGFGL